MGMNFKETIAFLDIMYTSNIKLVPCLMGHTGVGKTEIYKQYARARGKDLIIIHVAQLEPSDFVGLYHVSEDKRTSNCPPDWLPYKEMSEDNLKIVEAHANTPEKLAAALQKACSHGEINPNGGIVFLDEVNRAHEDMRQALYQFLQDRTIHTYTLPQGTQNEDGSYIGRYDIGAAGNPPSEGYEAYEFDPALVNRLAFINFVPSFEETKNHLQGKHGRNLVLSWVDSNKDLVDYGDEFEINDLLYTPRNVEEHILLFNRVRKNPDKSFKRKVFETIMQKEKVQSFMAFLEEVEYINFKDIMNGVSGDKQKKLETLLKDNRMDIISTITNDLAEYWQSHNLGDKTNHYKDEKLAIQHTVDFLESVEDEVCCAFIDGLKKSYDNPKCIVNDTYFRKILKPKLKKYAHVFNS